MISTMLRAAILILLAFHLNGCKSKQVTPVEPKSEEVSAPEDTPGEIRVVTAPPMKEVKIPKLAADTTVCSMLVSFYSRGAGTDFNTVTAFDRYVTDYGVTGKKSPRVERIPWGREGEIDYCIRWHELNSSEIKAFEEGAKQIVEKSELVHISYNAACKHKR